MKFSSKPQRSVIGCLRNDMMQPIAHCAENAKQTSKRICFCAIKAAHASWPISASCRVLWSMTMTSNRG